MKDNLHKFPISRAQADKLTIDISEIPKTEEEMKQRLAKSPAMFAAFKYGQNHMAAIAKPGLEEGIRQAARADALAVELKAAREKIAELESSITALENRIDADTHG